MTGCSCGKVLDEVSHNVRLVWNPDCEEHGIDSPAWTERITSDVYRERANKILNKLDEIRRKRT